MLLKNKNFILLFVGTLVSNIGNILFNFAISFYILDITNKNAAIQGIYLAVCGIVFLIFSPIAGVIADRYNKAKIVYWMDFVKGAIILCSALAIYYTNNSTQLILLFILAVILNIIGAIFGAASGSLLRFIVEDDQLQNANSYFAGLRSFQNIVGVLLAGVLITFLSIEMLFIIVGVLYLISGISEIFIHYEYVNSEDKLKIKTFIDDIKGAIVYLSKEKAIIALICSVLFINFFITPIFSNSLSYFIKTDVVGDYLFSNFVSPELWMSILEISLSIGSIVFALVIANMKPKEHYNRQIKFGLFIFSVVLTVMTIFYYIFVERNNMVSYYLIVLTLSMFTIGCSLSIVNIPIETSIQKKVDKDKLAKVSSLLNVGSQGLTPIATLLGGLVISGLGLTWLMAICSIGFALSFVFTCLNKNFNEL